MLLRLAGEGGSNNAQFEQDPVPLHACRALGQLGAGSAARALVKRLGDCSDALSESVLFALSMVGLPGLEALEGFFDSPDIDRWAQIRVAEGVAVFADRNPTLRARCVTFLMQALSRSAQWQATVNGFLVYYLVELKATEASAVIEQAFLRNQVDEDVLGWWPDVQIQLGLAKVTDFSPELLLYAGELYPIPTVSELLREQRLSDA